MSAATTAVRTGPIVVCDAVGRTFRRRDVEVPAVTAVSCSVRPGCRIAVTGPSGSGKSTLLHLLAGLEEPTCGAVTWPGLGRAPREPGAIGVVFQGPALVAALDVTENVALPLMLAGRREPDALHRARVALDRLRIGELAGSLPDELSGGQAQRVAVARVLAAEPRLILADEPTGRLDRATARLVLDELVRTADELGAALVVSTHDAVVAGRLDRQWSMDDGALVTGQGRR